MFKDGFHIIKTPAKYQTERDDLRQSFKKLTPIERIVYSAYQIRTLREIAKILRKSKDTIRRIYLRAEGKIKQ